VEGLAKVRERIEQNCTEEINRVLLRFKCRMAVDMLISSDSGITPHIKVRAIE